LRVLRFGKNNFTNASKDACAPVFLEMEKTEVLQIIEAKKLVPVIRTSNLDEARTAVEVLALAGFEVFEITLTIPNATELIRELSEKHSDILLGAGTVLNAEQAKNCIESGAKFIVSPAFDLETVKFCNAENIAVMPGALTPTEVFSAWKSGADVVKVFPSDALGGAKYVKTLKSVFPHIKIMPTGGVSLETIADFLKSGAIAVGVGTDLVDVKAIREGNLELIAEKSRKYLEAVR